MRPNILENEYIPTKKVSSFDALEAGDVIVFSFSAWKALDFQEEERPDCVGTQSALSRETDYCEISRYYRI